ncbi:nucleotidyltransferase [Ignicoccus pacificus DSM 13166]|uniref:Nucleotidyltransferase n=1 Tax=Ignicoccus pacificus DSM 13166 TaxID=940294 RepID=A0A977PKM0_9CREN|nr:nucleotidyltransferase [Ignicoccus pacificus DSM 13166]
MDELKYLSQENVKRVKVVEKPWGREIWIADEPEYGGKIIEIKKGYSTSVHYHRQKKETIYVDKGTLKVRSGPNEFLVQEGEEITIEPYTVHQLIALEDVRLIEVSTQPLNERVRIEDPYASLRSPEDKG